ncbi:MAG: hypothetical protein IPO06_25620, partial [Leptospiraceae bacterium]|nr:hypothetical protein [Leptospiraceae bacterium]
SVQSISAVTFAEDGSSTITAQVVLATLPTGNVTISNIISSDLTEGIVLPNGGGGSITNRTDLHLQRMRLLLEQIQRLVDEYSSDNHN